VGRRTSRRIYPKDVKRTLIIEQANHLNLFVKIFSELAKDVVPRPYSQPRWIRGIPGSNDGADLEHNLPLAM
jgi:hypothetical protein